MTRRLLSALALTWCLSSTAHAVPVNFHGTVSGPTWNYTLIHGCATPSGCPSIHNWFAGGQSISGTADFETGSLTAYAHSYTTHNSDIFHMNSLSVIFDPLTGRGINGQMAFTYAGVSGNFSFTNMNMGPWNSIILPDAQDQFGAYLWGGDAGWVDPNCSQTPTLTHCDQGLGIDFVFTASIPEPGTLVLFGLGLLGLAFAARKKSHV